MKVEHCVLLASAILTGAMTAAGAAGAGELSRLRVSKNGHFLITAAGRPFF